MAKSLKSKWKRKMRNIKREKYGKKELEQLKKIAEAAKEGDQEMKELYTGILISSLLLSPALSRKI